MAPATLKLTNRSPRKPIRGLPASVEIPVDVTVDNVKVLIARQCGISDHNRIGLFNPATNKTLKDRNAIVLADADISRGKELLVKDLGPQISWKMVFVIEYLGPLLVHPLILFLRPYIYPWATPTPLSDTQRLAFGLVMAHFVKRELETLFVHKFSNSTMPVFNIFRNSAFYWIFYGLVSAYAIYSPTSLAATADEPLVDLVGTVIFVLAELANGSVHLHLSSLRSRGGTERKIPTGLGFSLVTCPNYMFEVIAWVGAVIATRSWGLALSVALGITYMAAWAKGKERAYRKEFPDKYKKKRYVMLPGLI
ncbi:related to TSC13 - required for elongation of VLCFA moiety of sphingolipids [Cephalotrichum gorgonifer]|uniref:very-long-chain enoyl-CoA reductase n=1 Tax=Cephalotrichum gorgonifer TaxID=2041049 RepID=A0AAE8N075_9PEZI|nr:related to TSC13 - required for elongation of VLCFA moiety of sphingolipids [Cephalotrichum gorgonifer]